jgi:hypothetical protein
MAFLHAVEEPSEESTNMPGTLRRAAMMVVRARRVEHDSYGPFVLGEPLVAL